MVTVLFGGAASALWVALTTGGSRRFVLPAVVCSLIAAVGLYCVFAPLMGWWPWRGAKPQRCSLLVKAVRDGHGLASIQERTILWKEWQHWHDSTYRMLWEGWACRKRRRSPTPGNIDTPKLPRNCCGAGGVFRESSEAGLGCERKGLRPVLSEPRRGKRGS